MDGAAKGNCFRKLAPLARGAQGVAYDMAFRGKHNQELLQLGLIPIDKVAAKRKGFKTDGKHIPRVPKDAHVEDKPVRLEGGTVKLCRLYALDGAIGLGEVDDKGRVRFVRLKNVDRDRKANKRGGYRWYNTYEVPKAFGGGGTVTVRMDQTDEDTKRGFNRTENVRIIPYSDDDFKALYRLRQDAKSINRALEDTLYLRRAHSLGHLRQQVDIFGYALMVNSLAVHLSKRRALPKARAA
jgi:hypothetical protein